MYHSETTSFTRKVLLRSKRFVSGLRTIERSQDDSEERERLIGEKSFVQETFFHQRLPLQVQVTSSPTPNPNDAALSQRHAQVAQDLRLSLPSSCRWLRPEVVKLVREGPIDAGGFANIWEAAYNGRRVVLKSYRCYVSFDVAQVAARFYNEIVVCTLLRDRGVDVVPLVGVYSTEIHPFGLIYEHMGGRDIKQYLRNNPNAERLQLVTAIARWLNRMHGLGIVHGDLQTTNILVDKDGTPHIAGLGNAYFLPDSTARTPRTSTELPYDGRAPESGWPGISLGATSATRPTKANDMCAFGVLIFEVFTGRPPFFGLSGIAATYSMLNGSRPSRPDCREVSDLVWRVIEGCWNPDASRRMEIEEVVTLLEEELSRILPPRVQRTCWKVKPQTSNR